MENVWGIWGHQTGFSEPPNTFIHFYLISKFVSWGKFHIKCQIRSMQRSVWRECHCCHVSWEFSAFVYLSDLWKKTLPHLESWLLSEQLHVTQVFLTSKKKKSPTTHTRVRCVASLYRCMNSSLNGNSLSLSLSAVSRSCRRSLNTSISYCAEWLWGTVTLNTDVPAPFSLCENSNVGLQIWVS